MDPNPSFRNNISVFFETHLTVSDFAKHLGLLIGIQPDFMNTDNGVSYRWHLLGLEVVLFDGHGLENDKGINFSSFPYELDFVHFSLQKNIPEQNALTSALAVWIALSAVQKYRAKAIVVENLQKLIASYGGGEPKGSGNMRSS